jgi:hypothetical protein
MAPETGQFIGSLGSLSSASRSPDLNPLDFFLWGHLRNVMCTSVVNIEVELLQRIQNGCNRVRKTSGIFQRFHQSVHRLAEACVALESQHFGHPLYALTSATSCH